MGGTEEAIIIFLVFHLHSLTNIHLIHRDFYHSCLLDLFVITRLMADETQICAFYLHFMDAFKSELQTLAFQSDCENFSSCQTITLLLQSKRLGKLRFTPLATAVYLSHPPSPTLSRNLSSNRFPKCIRNEGYLIFFARD